MAEKTRECPACALEGPANEEACPYCGYEYPDRPGRLTTLTVIIIVALLALPLVWFLRYLF